MKLRSAVHNIEKTVNEQGLAELSVIMLMCRRHEKDYLMRGDSKYLDSISKRISEFDQQMEEFGLASGDQEKIKAQWNEYFASMKSIVEIDKQITQMKLEFNNAAQQLVTAVDLINEHASTNLKTAEANVLHGLSWTQKILQGVLGGAIVIGCLIALMTTRSIMRPMNQLLDRFRDISEGEGDLTQRVEVKSKDEFGELAKAFNRFVDDIQQVIFHAKRSAANVAEAAHEIAATNDQMTGNAENQSRQIIEVAAAIEEMSATAANITTQAQVASKSAGEARESAEHGGADVKNTIQGMQSISSSVSSTADSVITLGEQVNQIGEILTVINDIADQTNLLALNAAIEAARAGEHGRGFAVVADEVRKLADRTTTATSEIATSIDQIQKETNEAVERINRGTSEVQQGVELASNAGCSLEKIVNEAAQVRDQIFGIASGAEQQAATAGSISQNVETISQMTRETTAGIKTASVATTQLSQRAMELQELVSRFIVQDDQQTSSAKAA